MRRAAASWWNQTSVGIGIVIIFRGTYHVGDSRRTSIQPYRIRRTAGRDDGQEWKKRSLLSKRARWGAPRVQQGSERDRRLRSCTSCTHTPLSMPPRARLLSACAPPTPLLQFRRPFHSSSARAAHVLRSGSIQYRYGASAAAAAAELSSSPPTSSDEERTS